MASRRCTLRKTEFDKFEGMLNLKTLSGDQSDQSREDNDNAERGRHDDIDSYM
jgi:hypothetical protein